jgi:hypothetical protein
LFKVPKTIFTGCGVKGPVFSAWQQSRGGEPRMIKRNAPKSTRWWEVMATRYLYPVAGGGRGTYYVIENSIYDTSSGKALFYIRGDTVYSHDDGRAAYKIDDRFHYDCDIGFPIFYFSE